MYVEERKKEYFALSFNFIFVNGLQNSNGRLFDFNPSGNTLRIMETMIRLAQVLSSQKEMKFSGIIIQIEKICENQTFSNIIHKKNVLNLLSEHVICQIVIRTVETLYCSRNKYTFSYPHLIDFDHQAIAVRSYWRSAYLNQALTVNRYNVVNSHMSSSATLPTQGLSEPMEVFPRGRCPDRALHSCIKTNMIIIIII